MPGFLPKNTYQAPMQPGSGAGLPPTNGYVHYQQQMMSGQTPSSLVPNTY